MNRRDFLTNSSASALGLSFLPKWSFRSTADFDLKILATGWGWPGDFESYCKKVKEEGYDGIEAWLPGSGPKRDNFFAQTKAYDLPFGLLFGAWQTDFQEHFEYFKRNIISRIGRLKNHQSIFRVFNIFDESR